MYFNLPLTGNDLLQKVTDSVLFLSFGVQDVQLLISLLSLNFPFFLYNAFVVKLGCIFLLSASAPADCAQDGDPEIILCNI